MTMVQNMITITRNRFKVTHLSDETGIQAPSSLRWRKHRKRVLLHPTSAEDAKNWPIDKFLNLAHRLADRQFEIVFIMSEKELDAWRPKILEAQDRSPIPGSWFSQPG
jgi:ADP-heptose:LPS heptosyltransferase